MRIVESKEFDLVSGGVVVDFHGKLTQGFHPILSHPI